MGIVLQLKLAEEVSFAEFWMKLTDQLMGTCLSLFDF